MNSFSVALFAAALAYASAGVLEAPVAYAAPSYAYAPAVAKVAAPVAYAHAPTVAKVAAAPVAYAAAPAYAKVAAPGVYSVPAAYAYETPLVINAFSPQGAFAVAPQQGYFLDQLAYAAPVIKTPAVAVAKAVAPVAKAAVAYDDHHHHH